MTTGNDNIKVQETKEGIIRLSLLFPLIPCFILEDELTPPGGVIRPHSLTKKKILVVFFVRFIFKARGR